MSTINASLLKQEAQRISGRFREEYEQISDFIFHHAELGGEEVQSSRYLAQVLADHGFTVRFPWDDLPTAFVAEYSRGEGPRIGFLAEYDALPGYERWGGNAHACGHNWIAATMCGCGITLAELMKREDGFCGTVVVFGTPAEETFGGKVVMARKGAFDRVDVAFQAHLEESNAIDSRALAMNSLEFTITGKAAHAASFPEDGINALDAVNLTFAGINALRQHVKQDVRMHGIITEGGVATNIVPDRAVCRFTIRSKSRDYLKYVRKRVEDCARGAALISGASLSIGEFENPFDDMVNVPSLIEATKKNFEATGITDFRGADQVAPPGSTDLGNVSYICPTLYVELDLEAEQQLHVHEEEALNYVNSPCAYRKMMQTIDAFTSTAIDLVCQPEVLEEIKREHRSLIEPEGREQQ